MVSLYALTLPLGYAIVSPLYPPGRLPWRDFLGLTFLVLIWPIAALVLLLEAGRRP